MPHRCAQPSSLLAVRCQGVINVLQREAEHVELLLQMFARHVPETQPLTQRAPPGSRATHLHPSRLIVAIHMCDNQRGQPYEHQQILGFGGRLDESYQSIYG